MAIPIVYKALTDAKIMDGVVYRRLEETGKWAQVQMYDYEAEDAFRIRDYINKNQLAGYDLHDVNDQRILSRLENEPLISNPDEPLYKMSRQEGNACNAALKKRNKVFQEMESATTDLAQKKDALKAAQTARREAKNALRQAQSSMASATSTQEAASILRNAQNNLSTANRNVRNAIRAYNSSAIKFNKLISKFKDCEKIFYQCANKFTSPVEQVKFTAEHNKLITGIEEASVHKGPLGKLSNISDKVKGAFGKLNNMPGKAKGALGIFMLAVAAGAVMCNSLSDSSNDTPVQAATPPAGEPVEQEPQGSDEAASGVPENETQEAEEVAQNTEPAPAEENNAAPDADEAEETLATPAEAEPAELIDEEAAEEEIAEDSREVLCTVQPGDCLWNICKRELREQNGGTDPTGAQIITRIGEVMTANGLQWESDGQHVMIRPGETLYK